MKEATGATSCEISFGTLPTGAAVPFFHSHKANEENYIILSGAGKFQVDDNVFDVAEGSVIRVSTNCGRNLKCTSTEAMDLYLHTGKRKQSRRLYNDRC